MAFEQTSFLGATIIGLRSNVGWNEQQTQVVIDLVEDRRLGDVFTRPLPGSPTKVVFGDFSYEGLIQYWTETDSFEGNPVFQVIITDPREVLAGVQVIISAFRGFTNNMPNLINAFGYWEAILGFGGSMVNESGMLWNAPLEILHLQSQGQSLVATLTEGSTVGIKTAIERITFQGNNYGGPINFMNTIYPVDLSGLPVPPSYYRIGGVSVSIMDAVSQLCQDAGVDYICFLEDGIIKFKTVSRLNQPQLGQVANFIMSQTDFTTRSAGLELRNDLTNAVILGGSRIDLFQEFNPGGGDTIWPFWGFDVTGQVIIGNGAPEEGHTMLLNAVGIEDIIGDLVYPADLIELRFALMDFDSWAAYVLKWWPDKADTINLVSAVDARSNLGELFQNTLLQRDLIAMRNEEIMFFGQMNETEYWTQRAQRVYEFVRNVATEFFGRKFLVRIPFWVFYAYESETTHIVSSYETSDAGYVPEGSMPLGLQFLNENVFLSPDGRFECFVRFSDYSTVDLSRIPPGAAVIQDNGLFVKASIDQDLGIFYPPGAIFPYVVVTLSTPVYQFAPDPLGGVEDIAAMLELPVEQITLAAGYRYDSFPIKIHPAPMRPDAVALPLKSNRDSYGPWGTFPPWGNIGKPGKVNFQRDEELVPWNYGGFGIMDLAAMAKIAGAATNMQIAETGIVEEVGLPRISLGDTLIEDGPNVTGIDIAIGTGGVKTTYNMRTFTPQFGAFAKANADRLRRLGIWAQDARRALRNLYQQRLQIQNLIYSAQLGFMANTSRAVRQQTPHSVLLGNMVKDDNFGYRTQVAALTLPEAVANVRGDIPSVYNLSAVMGMEGLLRPFSTNQDIDDNDTSIKHLPHYENPSDGTKNNLTDFDPVGEKNDIDIITTANEYPGSLHARKKDLDMTNARLLGLRGPLWVVGFGFEYTGKPVPNADPTGRVDQWSDDFLEDFRTKAEKWKAGPVGLFWDHWRKVWTIPTILMGTMDADVAADASAKMTIKGIDSVHDKVKVYNYLGGSSPIKQGKTVIAAYYQLTDEWIIIAAKC